MATYSKVVVEDSADHIAQTSAKADVLATARNLGGVSFNGSENIDLPGVNTGGNQDTTGNSATSTALATARAFSATGDVTTSSSVNFDGSGAVALALSIGADKVTNRQMADASVKPEQFNDGSDRSIGNGTDGQFLKTDGSGGMGWANVPSPNNNLITLTAGSGLTGGGDFTVDQNSDEELTFDLDASVAGTGLSHSSGVLAVEATQAITNVTGDFAIAGDLTVSGKTITTATETLEIADNTMLLNSDATRAESAGLMVETETGNARASKPVMYYDASASAWKMGVTESDFASATSKSTIASIANNSSLDNDDVSVPVGGIQEVSGVIYVRTS